MFAAPVEEQRFVLDHIANIGTLATGEHPGGVEPEIVDAILEGAGAFAAGEWAPLNRVGDTDPPRWSDGQVTMPPGFRAAYQAFVEGGWGTIALPTRFGGQGMPNALAIAVAESLGAANMAFALCPALTTGAVEALASHGSAEQQQAYLGKLVSGDWSGTMNLTEPQAGSDVGALRSMATPAQDGSWRIKGTKIYISFGEHDLTENIIHLVLARTPNAPAGTKGISLFLVPKILPDGSRNDVSCVSIEHKMGLHASPTCVMSFGDHDACQGWLIGPELQGMRAMFTMMNNARINIGLQGVQIAERATQKAIAYARERIQSARADDPAGGPVAIIEHPDVRRMLMRMKAQTQAIRALLYATGAEIDRSQLGLDGAKARLDLLTPLAKSHATDVGCEVTSLGIQVQGGMGFIEEAGAAQYYRDIRIAPIYEGTNGIQAADLVGRKLMGDNGAALSALIRQVQAEARDAGLLSLTARVKELGTMLLGSHVRDRLAASCPFLTMVSVMVCGWLMEKQGRIAGQLGAEGGEAPAFLRAKQASSQWYLRHLVPEALGLAASVMVGAQGLYDLSAEELAL